MGAVIGTILAAVFVGLFLSSLNPTESTVGEATPTPSPTPLPTPSLSVAPSVSATAVPTPTPVPLPATVAFGTELDGNRVVVSPVDTFTPGMTFAHSITSTQPFGAATIGEEIVRLNEDGTDGEQIVAPAGNQLGVDPEGTTAGFVAGDAANFVRDWGPGRVRDADLRRDDPHRPWTVPPRRRLTPSPIRRSERSRPRHRRRGGRESADTRDRRAAHRSRPSRRS